DVDRYVGTQGLVDQLERLPEPRATLERQRVLVPFEHDGPFAAEHLANDRDVLARAFHRTRKGLTIPPFDDLWARDSEAEDEAALGEMIDGHGRHGNAGRRAGR